METKLCNSCGIEKPIDQFKLSKSRGYYYRARKCNDCRHASHADKKDKRCGKCGIYKLISEFGKDKSQPDGYRFWCKQCNNQDYNRWYETDPGKSREVAKNWRKRNPEKRQKIYEDYRSRSKDLVLYKLYGLSLEEFKEMLEAQGGVCYICGGPPSNGKELAVDHNHTTGKIRKLLCGKCNTTLGNVKEDIVLLRKMIEYLMEHND